MNLYYLLAEILFDLVAVILGLAIIGQKTDNLPKFYWGIISVLIGSVFIWENVNWIIIRNENPVFEYTDILNIEKMLKWYFLATIVSLFPLASLRPGYLTGFRLVVFFIVPIIVTTIGICYLWFGGDITPLESAGMALANLEKPDVELRVTIFAFTIINPLLYFIGPLTRQKVHRKINPMMFFFMGFLFVLLVIYILFTLCINEFIFNGFGIASLAFSIFFSIQYLKVENPLSDYVEADSNEKNTDQHPMPLYYMINESLIASHDFADPKYTIDSLAESLNEKAANISAAIKSGGHTGFREYINHLRLEYFKYQASLNPQQTIKELMYLCGFTSRTTFYRIFAEKNGITPTEFIESQPSKSE